MFEDIPHKRTFVFSQVFSSFPCPIVQEWAPFTLIILVRKIPGNKEVLKTQQYMVTSDMYHTLLPTCPLVTFALDRYLESNNNYTKC